MNNLSSYSGLVDARISASDKDLPVHTTVCKTYVPSLTGKCFFLGGMALNLVSFQFSKMSIPPNILPTVSLLGPVSAEDRRTRSMGKLSSFKLSMFKIDEAEPRSMAASVLVLQTNLDLRKMFGHS